MAGFLKKLFGGSDENKQELDEQAIIASLKSAALYSVFNGDDQTESFGVVKILVLDPPAVHIRVFDNNFSARPVPAPENSVSVIGSTQVGLRAENGGDMKESVGFASPHMPLDVHDFVTVWKPVFLMDAAVEDSELKPYSFWLEQNS